MKVWERVQGGGVHSMGESTRCVILFLIGQFEIEQSEATKSHMFNMSSKLTNHTSLMCLKNKIK